MQRFVTLSARDSTEIVAGLAGRYVQPGKLNVVVELSAAAGRTRKSRSGTTFASAEATGIELGREEWRARRAHLDICVAV